MSSTMARMASRLSRSYATATTTSSSSTTPTISLNNIPATFSSLKENQKMAIIRKLKELHKGDWNAMSMEEKKASWYVAYGAYGPRAKFSRDHYIKVATITCFIMALGVGAHYSLRAMGQEHPETLSKEWQQATKEYLKGQGSNPIFGVSAKDYDGKHYD